MASYRDGITTVYEVLNIFQSMHIESKTDFDRYLKKHAGEVSKHELDTLKQQVDKATELSNQALVNLEKVSVALDLANLRANELAAKIADFEVNDPTLTADHELMKKLGIYVTDLIKLDQNEIYMLSSMQAKIEYANSPMPMRWFNDHTVSKKDYMFQISTSRKDKTVIHLQHVERKTLRIWYQGDDAQSFDQTYTFQDNMMLKFNYTEKGFSLILYDCNFIRDSANDKINVVKTMVADDILMYIVHDIVTFSVDGTIDGWYINTLSANYGVKAFDGFGRDFFLDTEMSNILVNKFIHDSMIAEAIHWYNDAEKAYLARLKHDENGNQLVDMVMQNAAVIEKLTNAVSDLSVSAVETKTVTVDIEEVQHIISGIIVSALTPEWTGVEGHDAATSTAYYDGDRYHIVIKRNGGVVLSTDLKNPPDAFEDIVPNGKVTENMVEENFIIGNKTKYNLKMLRTQTVTDPTYPHRKIMTREMQYSGSMDDIDHDYGKLGFYGDSIYVLKTPVKEEIQFLIWDKTWTKAPTLSNVNYGISIDYLKNGESRNIVFNPVAEAVEIVENNITYGAIKVTIDTTSIFKATECTVKSAEYALFYIDNNYGLMVGGKGIMDKITTYEEGAIYIGHVFPPTWIIKTNGDNWYTNYDKPFDQIEDIEVRMESGTYTIANMQGGLHKSQGLGVFSRSADSKDITTDKKFQDLRWALFNKPPSECIKSPAHTKFDKKCLWTMDVHFRIKMDVTITVSGKPIDGNEKWDPSVTNGQTILKQLLQMATQNVEQEIVQAQLIEIVQREVEEVQEEMEKSESVLDIIKKFAQTLAPELALVIDAEEGFEQFIKGMKDHNLTEMFDGLAAMMPSMANTFSKVTNDLHEFLFQHKKDSSEELPKFSVAAARSMFIRKIKAVCKEFKLEFESWMLGKVEGLMKSEHAGSIFAKLGKEKNDTEDMFNKFKNDAEQEILNHVKLDILNEEQNRAVQNLLISIGGYMFDKFKGLIHLDEIWASLHAKLKVFKSDFDKTTKYWFDDVDLKDKIIKFKAQNSHWADLTDNQILVFMMQSSGKDVTVSNMAYDVQDELGTKFFDDRENYGMTFGAVKQLVKLHRGDTSCALVPAYINDVHVRTQKNPESAVYKCLHERRTPYVMELSQYTNMEHDSMVMFKLATHPDEIGDIKFQVIVTDVNIGLRSFNFNRYKNAEVACRTDWLIIGKPGQDTRYFHKKGDYDEFIVKIKRESHVNLTCTIIDAPTRCVLFSHTMVESVPEKVRVSVKSWNKLYFTRL